MPYASSLQVYMVHAEAAGEAQSTAGAIADKPHLPHEAYFVQTHLRVCVPMPVPRKYKMPVFRPLVPPVLRKQYTIPMPIS
jgi:hypothetical protein